MEKVKKVLLGLKKHIKLIIVLIILVIIAVLVKNFVLGSPKKTVKEFFEAFEAEDAGKIAELIDFKGGYVFFEECEMKERYFDDEYIDFDEDDDYYQNGLDHLEDGINDVFDEIDDYNNYFGGYFSLELVEIKGVSKSKKSKRLYEVKTKIKIENENDKETVTGNIFVIKTGFSTYKIVGCDEKIGYALENYMF